LVAMMFQFSSVCGEAEVKLGISFKKRHLGYDDAQRSLS
jgi:hypothetical protein